MHMSYYFQTGAILRLFAELITTAGDFFMVPFEIGNYICRAL